jgi:predicted transposase YbfD/YdcC
MSPNPIKRMAVIQTHFAQLPDPRLERRRLHNLIDIIVIGLCAIMCGCESWADVERYGKTKHAWLKTFLELPNDIPSHDTFGRVFALLDPQEFQKCFTSWITAVCEATAGRVVAIDGKTVRGSADRAGGKHAIHLVSAWAVQNHLVLGQRAVADKSNEITAIPELLKILELTGAIVTIDAMGCQTEIAAAIRDKGADYILRVKDNQETLHDLLQQEFRGLMDYGERGVDYQEYQTRERSHGRQETRTYYAAPLPESIRASGRWRDARTLLVVVAERQLPDDDEPSMEFRFYISSLPCAVKKLAAAARGHWGIENSLHWVLDVSFDEDRSRVRKDHGPDNLAWLRRMSVSLLKQYEDKNSIRGKRLIAGWNNDYLMDILKSLAKK